jgi:hypothetical protein
MPPALECIRYEDISRWLSIEAHLRILITQIHIPEIGALALGNDPQGWTWCGIESVTKV